MHPLATQIIRTLVPYLIGALLAWLATMGVVLPVELAAALDAALTALLGSLYYVVVALLERYVAPQWGWLLGVARTPEYAAAGKHREE